MQFGIKHRRAVANGVYCNASRTRNVDGARCGFRVAKVRMFSPFSIHVRFSLDTQYGTRKLNGWSMTSKRLTCAALLLAGSSLLLATQSFAQTPPPHGGWHPSPGHGGGHPHFAFHHDFAHFSVGERSAWVGGRWNHGYHNGRFGWWWFAGGAWYFYNAPIYPYPGYVSDTYVDDDSYGPQGQSWYYCQNPPGYYPYVQRCRMQWQPVPAAAPPGGGYGPQQGPGPGYDGPPQGYNGPPQGYNGPPPGYNGPPPGPNNGPPDDQPPPGYQDGPPPGYQPPQGYQGPGQGPGPGDQGPPGYPPGYQNQGPPPPPGQGPGGPPPPPNN
jgi:hypothetical protein